MFTKVLKFPSIVAMIGLLSACGPSANQNVKSLEKDKALEGVQDTSDLYIVDCLLPGQVRQLGGMKYITPRRPIRTTAVNCRIRGGEYVAYDRADYRSALNVWLPKAKEGDKEAQNYVGEIFEKGLGQEPDYLSAVEWYRKSAEQGFERAQINLGYLYEKGLGVEKSITTALNWYRRASGVEGDTLMLSSEAKAEVAAAKKALTAKLTQANVQADFLEKQIASLKTKVVEYQAQAAESQETKTALEAAQQQIAALSELFENATKDKVSLQSELSTMEVAYRSVSDSRFLEPESLAANRAVEFKDINFGKYYALIIANQDYIFLDDLRSPMRDAQRLQQILEQQYGFSTLLVQNANEKNILNTINSFYDQVGEDDNLLIYYAGHGNISKSDQSRTERGYWLPVDAGKENISNWINNSVISDHLDRLKARSVLVISDSCYAGYLGSEKSPFLFGVSGGDESERAIKSGLSRRARVVISSGGLKPVLDGFSNEHSIFAAALIDALENNRGTMRDSTLFSRLSVNMRKRSEQSKIDQNPEMKPVREAGHEGGTFYFVATM